MTAVDGINPLKEIKVYSQIIDPIINSKNFYFEVNVETAINATNSQRYRFDAFIVLGELLRYDMIPRNGYGCKFRFGYSNIDNYDFYTLEFNNNYGSTGINSVTIPIDTSSANFNRIGIGYNYSTKSLFFHIQPDKYGNEYGLEIKNVEFPKNTRVYAFLVDVDKLEFTGDELYPAYITMIFRSSDFIFTDVANKYITGGGGYNLNLIKLIFST